MLPQIATALATNGLTLRGGFDFAEGEERPAGPSGKPAVSVLLVGNAGAGYWRHFSRWRAAQPVGLKDPLDTWSRAVIGEVAAHVGARLLMPNDKPYAPFQQWAVRAEGLRASPLGILIHPEYGLWHSYRGALMFDHPVGARSPARRVHPCDRCTSKPCLSACPVEAFSGGRFAYEACLAHVRGPDGAACREQGCLARNACPAGAAFRYPAEVQAFHQKAFAGL